MKKLTKGFLFLLCFVCLSLTISYCSAQSAPMLNSKEGIQFKITSLATAKALAKAENKPLFVFAHATWCSTCKQMENEVLIKKELGDAYNNAFLNVAIDIDSPDGKLLKAVYPINGTPTLFFFTTDGSLANKIVGFATSEVLMNESKTFKN